MYFILGANSCMFWHHGAIFREFINYKYYRSNIFQVLVALTSIIKSKSYNVKILDYIC